MLWDVSGVGRNGWLLQSQDNEAFMVFDGV